MHSRDTALRAASVRGKDKNSLGWQQSGFAANCGLFVTAACQDEEPGTATRIRGADPGAKLSVGLGTSTSSQLRSPVLHLQDVLLRQGHKPHCPHLGRSTQQHPCILLALFSLTLLHSFKKRFAAPSTHLEQAECCPQWGKKEIPKPSPLENRQVCFFTLELHFGLVSKSCVMFSKHCKGLAS